MKYNPLVQIGIALFSIFLLNSISSCTPCDDICQGPSQVVFLADKDFPGKMELYMNYSDGDAQGVQKISPEGPDPVDNFKISPNGKQIFFTTFDTTNSKVLRYDIETNSTFTRGLEVGKITKYRWSPNSSRIALVAKQVNGNDFALLRMEGSVLDTALLTPIISTTEVTDDPFAISWSPDGFRIAYTHPSIIDSTVQVIYVNIANGTASTESIVAELAPGTVLQKSLSQDVLLWSPDGQYIAYKTFDNVNSSVALNRVEVNNTINNQTLYSNGSGNTLKQVRWSPDGIRIAFVEDDLTQYNLRLISYDGSDERILATHIPATSLPTVPFRWSPDSTRIVFMSDEDSNSVNETILYTVLTDTKDVLGQPSSGLFDWSDTNNLAFVSAGIVYGFAENETNQLSFEGNAVDISWAPNGESLATMVQIGDNIGLQINSVYGSDLIKLRDLDDTGGSVLQQGVQWTNNNAYVVFKGVLPNMSRALISFNPSKKDRVNISGLLPSGQDIADFKLLPNN